MYRKYALALLTLTYTLHNVDRYILSISLEAIKHEFHVSDGILGLLSGLGYAVFYATLSIPVAIWADRSSRRNIIAMAVGLFSLMTMLCGMVSNFTQLALARLAVGVGESGTHPSSQSMIGDLFKREERGFAMGVFGSANNIGLLLSFLVGGWLNQLYGWRVAFLAVGAPGLILALVIRFTLREPTRGGADGLEGHVAAAPTISGVARFLVLQRAYVHIVLGCTIATFCMTGTINWFAPFLARSYGMAAGTIGTLLAFQLGIVGAIGTLAVGFMADKLGLKDIRWNLWILIGLYLVVLPLWIGVYLTDHKMITLTLFAFPALMTSAITAPSFSMIQALAPLRMRGVAVAIYLFSIAAIAGGLGPVFVGLVSDFLAHYVGEESLRYALLSIIVPVPWAVFHFWRCSVFLKEDIARADNFNAGQPVSSAGKSVERGIGSNDMAF